MHQLVNGMGHWLSTLALLRFAAEASWCCCELLCRTSVPQGWAGKSRHLPKAVS